MDWLRLAEQRPGFDAAARAALREQGTWAGLTLADCARRRAAREPEREAFIAGDETASYGMMLADAEALAASLWELGLRPGDVISFQLPNWLETVVIDLAASLLGLVCNPIVPIYRDAELAMILADCGSRCLFVPERWRDHDYAEMVRRLRPGLPALRWVVGVRCGLPDAHAYADLLAAGRGRAVAWPKSDPDAVKLIMYTSGTTGRAKGVLHSHDSLPTAVSRASTAWGLGAGDTVLMPSLVTHLTGYCCGIETPFQLGTRTVFMERWNANDALALIDAHAVNATVGATPFLQELVAAAEAAGARLPSLRVFACGGAAVPPELIARANRVLAGRAFRIYGSTEAPLITFGGEDTDSPVLFGETDGRINDYEVRIVDDNDSALTSGNEGEILARGPGMFLGYADPEQTRESFTADGFFRTGDMGVRTADDAIIITGRKKDLIIRGGENISAKEIEDLVHGHAAVREAAAVSMPHPRLGETVCLYLIPQAGADLSLPEICAHLAAAGLAKQKYPEHLEIVADFPRTPSGKIRKDQLRRRIAEQLAANPASGG